MDLMHHHHRLKKAMMVDHFRSRSLLVWLSLAAVGASLLSCAGDAEKSWVWETETGFPRPIEAGNEGNGFPLVLGDPEEIGDLYLSPVHVLDWDGDGKKELVGNGVWDLFSFFPQGALPDGTPIVDRGLRWGEVSRSPQREEETDVGLCGKIITSGDFDGDGRPEVILGPRGYSKEALVVLDLVDGVPKHRSQGLPLTLVDSTLSGETDPISVAKRWSSARMAAFDWDGNGRLDLVLARFDSENYNPIDPETGKVPRDPRERYTRLGEWKGTVGDWSLHLFRNTGEVGRPEFTYVRPIALPSAPPGGPLCPVDPNDPRAGLLILGYYGDLWHLPLLEPGEEPKWGELRELFDLQGAPFTRSANMLTIGVGNLDNSNRFDLFAGDISLSLFWCRRYGQDREGRPVYDRPKKVKQRNPHINGGYFSVVTTGDWRGTGWPDLLVGSVEGYIFWYKTLSTDPLRFAPPERVRVGNEEIRRYSKPDPAAGYHWGGSQGPLDGSNGGYSNPLLVDWDNDGLLDLLVGDMIGLYDWFPNRGTRSRPKLVPPFRLHVQGEQFFGPWRVRPGAGDFSGDGLPDLVAMDMELDLVLYRQAGGKDPSALLPGIKLRYEDGSTIKSHGTYTPLGGEGRGRTKIQVLDWDHDGNLDLLLGVGPQYESAFPGSYPLLCRNGGTNTYPKFERAVVLLFNAEGVPFEFWRHAAHPAAVDWDNDRQWELLVGADQGFVWYFKPLHFGVPNVPGAMLAPGRDPKKPAWP